MTRIAGLRAARHAAALLLLGSHPSLAALKEIRVVLMPEREPPQLAFSALRAAWTHHAERSRGTGPVWEDPEPLSVLLAGPAGDVPYSARSADEVVRFLIEEVLPRPTGNTHPGFLGWVHGSGDELAIVAGLLAAAMNANTGGREHGAVRIEQTVLRWLRIIFGFPGSSSAVFTQGTSEANLLALAIARTKARKRMNGVVPPNPQHECIYVTEGTHQSLLRAASVLQFAACRLIPSSPGQRDRMDPAALRDAISADRAQGRVPVLVAGTAGAVDSGACDKFDDLADVCSTEQVWLHVDGAFGAWLRIAPEPFDAPVRGIEWADSLALDLHKWVPSPFAAGALLVRDATAHRETFATSADYLRPSQALAGGPDWAVNYGVALSRPFQGLAPYLILRTRGLAAIGEAIAHCVVLAQYFADLLERSSLLRLAAPVVGNVVLFEALDPVGHPQDAETIAAHLQRRGETVFSTTTLYGRIVLRACFVNHNTRARDVELAITQLAQAAEELGGRVEDAC